MVRHFTFSSLAIMALASALTAGCAHVHPWEREDLGALDEHEEMESPSSSYDAHFWSVREGAAGGTGAAGGGCGCN